jgi:CBS domain containing-hemolysin-like protein
MKHLLFSFKKSSWIVVVILLLATAVPALGIGVQPPEGSSEDMGGDFVLLILYVLLALVFSFLCSIAEAVLLSITPSYIEGKREKQPKFAMLLKQIKQDNIDQSLAAILTLNTIAHTVGAIGAGAKATVVFGSAWFGVFSGVMTLMILFLSEIVPKTIGAVYWQTLARPAALFVKALTVSLYPIVWVSEKVTQFISRNRAAHIFNRDEFIAMASAGVKSGEINIKESRIIRNLLRFESLKVTDIMTPRTVISAVPQDMGVCESLEQVSKSPFSRLPIYSEHLDNVTGFILKEDVLIRAAQDRCDEKIEALKRNILAVPHSVSLPYLLERFLTDRQHIAIVVNEHGGLDGLVTLEDLIETIMGMEIMDEKDNIEDMRILARNRWVTRAKAMGLETDIFNKKHPDRLDTAGSQERAQE